MSKRIGLRHVSVSYRGKLPEIEVMSGGTGFSILATAATCVGTTQPHEKLYCKLTGVVSSYAAPRLAGATEVTSTSETMFKKPILYVTLTPA